MEPALPALTPALHTADLVVVGGYLLLVVLIALWVARRTDSGEDLFLAGRSLTWGVIGLSLFASNISSTTLIGLAGAAYQIGIAVSAYEWAAGLVLVFAALTLFPLYIRNRITTVPEFLELRFNTAVRKYFSVITIMLSVVVDTAGGIYAGAIVLTTLMPDLPFMETCVGLALFAGLYTAAGGLRAVVYTDVIQAVVLILGCGLITWYAFAALDFSWETVKQAVPEGHLSLVRPLDDDELPWLGLMTGVPLLGFWYWATNQYIVQRVLAAKSIEHAQWGAVLGGLLKLLPLFIMVLPGAMAISLFPGIATGDAVFPTLVTNLLPIGITGLVLAGLMAAIMSSIDSTLNAASTLIVHDFVLPRRKSLTPHALGRLGRTTTLILMVIAAAWAPNIRTFEGLWAYMQQMFAILVPPVVAIMVVGIFWRRGNGPGALWTLILGHSAALAWFVLEQEGTHSVHFTMGVGLTTLLSVVLFVSISLATAPPPTSSQAAVVDRGVKRLTQELPWYANVRVQSTIVVALTALLVLAFW